MNRVDPNLLVDYAWPRFLGRAERFVRALNDDQAVCDLLAALGEGSVAAPGGLYASVLPAPPPQATEVLPPLVPIDVLTACLACRKAEEAAWMTC